LIFVLIYAKIYIENLNILEAWKMEEKYFLLRKRGNVWYLQKGEKIYFYDESARKTEVIEVARVHPYAKEVKDVPQKVIDVFKK
jgi:hypothetical protein